MKLLCGAVRFDGRRLPEDLLARMTSAMTPSARQPSVSGWKGAHAVFATLNFCSRQGRPAHAIGLRDSGAVLACDVRLDEPATVARLLDAQDATPEALLEGVLDRSGVSGLSFLLGDFALAQWHARKRELTLARDGMGVRPLVYHHIPGKLVVFASFPRALHASGLVERTLNEAAMVREMLSASLAGETLFTGVESVRPGTSLTFTGFRCDEEEHWRPRLRDGVYRSPEEGAEALASAVRSAVKSRTGGEGPVGTHLSGGLDSSAVAVLAARRLQPEGRRLLAYQFVEGTSPAEDLERSYVQAVLQQEPSIEWFPVISGPSLVTPVLKLDCVLSDSPSDPENQACAHASERGAQTMLSGWGGDEGATFNGRGVLASALLSADWGYLMREISSLKTRRGFSSRQVVHGEVLSYLRREMKGALRTFQRDTHVFVEASFEMLRQEMRSAAIHPVTEGLRIGSRVRHNQLQLISGIHIAKRTSNWAEIGSAYGMAFAFPLLDRRVIECALAMPGSWYLREGWKRRPFRDAMQGVLPEIIRRRHDKLSPFPAALARLAAMPEPIFAKVKIMLQKPAFRALFDKEVIERLMQTFPDEQQLRHSPESADRILPFLPLLSYGEFLLREPSLHRPALRGSVLAMNPVRAGNLRG